VLSYSEYVTLNNIGNSIDKHPHEDVPEIKNPRQYTTVMGQDGRLTTRLKVGKTSDSAVSEKSAISTLLSLSSSGGTRKNKPGPKPMYPQTPQTNQQPHRTQTDTQRTITEIVVPAMKNGDLPYGGFWKFFPLPKVQGQSFDLSPREGIGWKLKLEPISFDADTIVLDIT
jgi:hypothetical protein